MRFVNSLLIGCITCCFSMHANINTINLERLLQQEQTTDKISATITKNTTEKQFEELIAYFKEYGIKLDISEVNYNEENEIIGIKILLQKGNQKRRYALSSNIPIDDLELGNNGDTLYIKTHQNNEDLLSSHQDLIRHFSIPNINLDSLLAENNFSFSFNNNDLRSLLNDFDLDAFQKQFFGTDSSEDEKPTAQTLPKKQGLPTYNFIDNPNTNKLIIIDGKEADFRTLDKLAKANKLEIVDSLKPETAVSIYGKKAADGAIIATTKK